MTLEQEIDSIVIRVRRGLQSRPIKATAVRAKLSPNTVRRIADGTGVNPTVGTLKSLARLLETGGER